MISYLINLVDQFGDTKGLGLLIFAAIMCHKAPASIGFGTYLVHQNTSVASHARHMGAFCFSSPLMNLITYFGLTATQDGATDLMALQFWVGILMLISAGSFLYVATIHILPEVYSSPDDEHSNQKMSTSKL